MPDAPELEAVASTDQTKVIVMGQAEVVNETPVVQGATVPPVSPADDERLATGSKEAIESLPESVPESTPFSPLVITPT